MIFNTVHCAQQVHSMHFLVICVCLILTKEMASTSFEDENKQMAILIDWDSDSPHLPEIFNIVQVSNFTHAWIDVMVLQVHQSIETLLLMSIRQTLHSLRAMYNNMRVDDSYQCGNTYHLSTLLHHFSLESNTECDTTWFIAVHRSLAVNITIEQAFVAYAKLCDTEESFIVVNEGHLNFFCIHCTFTIKYMCGHVYMETIYSKHNKASVRIKSSIDNIPFPTSIKAQYQAQTPNMAYMFSYTYGYEYDIEHIPGGYKHLNLPHGHPSMFGRKSINIPSEWTMNVPPSEILIRSPLMEVIWYLGNRGSIGITETMIVHTIFIDHYRCSDYRTSVLNVYKGLVSAVTQNMFPVSRYFCTAHKQHMQLNFHVYVTLKLMLLLHGKINISIIFSHTEYRINHFRKAHLKPGETRVYDSHIYSWHYLYLSLDHCNFQILTFDGPKKTVRFDLIHDPQMGSRKANEYGRNCCSITCHFVTCSFAVLCIAFYICRNLSLFWHYDLFTRGCFLPLQ